MKKKKKIKNKDYIMMRMKNNKIVTFEKIN